MARGRMLNKSVSGSIKFHNLPDDTCRLLASWIIPHLDVQGVFYGDPAMVRSVVFPRRTDVSVEQVEGYLLAMEGAGLMWRYESKGDTWQHWPGFLGEQVGLRADREAPEFPAPPDEQPEHIGNSSGTDPANIRQTSGKHPAEEKRSEEKRSEEEKARSFYLNLLERWSELFPDKTQPRPDTASNIDKVRVRIEEKAFVENWEAALERASRSSFCRESGWFQLDWFIKNKTNWEKCLNGNYDDKRNGKPPEGTGVQRNAQGWQIPG